MIGQRVEIWKKEEYSYADAYDFIPLLVSYIHEDKKIRPAMLVVPGGAYRYASPSEGDVVARWFYKAGYNVFVLAYTVNYLDEPLDRVPLNDISRAVRIIRKHAEACSIDPDQIVVCGFSAGGHLCASLCVHYKDVKDCRPEYDEVSNRPDAAILAYPVITSKGYEDSESFRALLGEKAGCRGAEVYDAGRLCDGRYAPVLHLADGTGCDCPRRTQLYFCRRLQKGGG